MPDKKLVPSSGRLTIAQGAEYAGFSRYMLYDLINDGTIQAYRIGEKGRLYVFKEDLDALLRAQPVAIGL